MTARRGRGADNGRYANGRAHESARDSGATAHMVIRIVSTEELQAEVARLTEQLRIARVALAEVVRRPLSPTIRTIATAALNELHAEE
jgi:hypothetical protein